MKFEIKCIQDNVKKRIYFPLLFICRNNTPVETVTVCDNMYLIRNYLALNNSKIFRFSPNSKKNDKFLARWVAGCSHRMKSHNDRHV